MAREPRRAVLRQLPSREAARRADARFLPDRLDYRAAYAKRWLAAANRLIPPNVFYFEHDGLAAKYAVLSEADFPPLSMARDPQRLGLGTLRPAVAAGVGAPTMRRAGAIEAIARAAPTLLGAAGRADGGEDRSTGGAERLCPDLFGRASRRAQGRAASIVDADPNAIDAFRSRRSRHRPRRQQRRGAQRRMQGKARCRCSPGQGERDLRRRRRYIAWKINRHAGTRNRIEAVAARAPAARRDQPAAAAPPSPGAVR